MSEFNIEGLSLVPKEPESIKKPETEEVDQTILGIFNEITRLSKEPQTENIKLEIAELQTKKEQLLAEKQFKQDEKYLIKNSNKPSSTPAWNNRENWGGAGLATK